MALFIKVVWKWHCKKTGMEGSVQRSLRLTVDSFFFKLRILPLKYHKFISGHFLSTTFSKSFLSGHLTNIAVLKMLDIVIFLQIYWLFLLRDLAQKMTLCNRWSIMHLMRQSCLLKSFLAIWILMAKYLLTCLPFQNQSETA